MHYYAAHADVSKEDVVFPYYREFVVEEYDIYTDSEGRSYNLPITMGENSFSKKLTKTGKREYEYNFIFARIAKMKDKYPDLINIFESELFQPYLDYYAMEKYYKKLTAFMDEENGDALDFI